MERLVLISNSVSASSEKTKEEPHVLIKKDKYLIEVILNRPKSLNALSFNTQALLMNMLYDLKNDNDVKVVLFKGQGTQAFCAGGDVKELMTTRQNDNDNGSTSLASEGVKFVNTSLYQISQMRPIQISIWNGIVMGGGVGLSIYSKIKIASEYAKFAMPECKIGLFTDVGSGCVLSRLKNGVGQYLTITGRTLVGKEICEVGLADYYIPRAKLAQMEIEVKEVIASKGKDLNIKDIHEVLQRYRQPVTSFKLEDFTRKHFTKSTLDEIVKSLKQSAETENCEISKKVLQEIDNNCPKSMRFTFELLKREKNVSPKEAFGMEIPAYLKMIGESDFFEGVKAMLFNKGSKPEWSHKSYTDVSEEELQSYFNLQPYDVDNKEDFERFAKFAAKYIQ